MDICLARDVIGADHHLVISGDTSKFMFVDVPPPSTFFLSPSYVSGTFDLNEYWKISGQSISMFPSGSAQKYFKSMESLYPHDSRNVHIKWSKTMPAQVYKSWIKALVEDIRSSLIPGWCEYYTTVFQETGAALRALERCSVDGQRLAAYRDQSDNERERTHLNSFSPLDDGLANAIRYSRSSSVTGRMTVARGPMILTLPKKFRNIMKSRYDGGSVIMLDYRCLEARIAAAMAGHRDMPSDMYAHMATSLFEEQLTRATVKRSIISRMYGGGKDSISDATGFVGDRLVWVLEKLDHYFDTHNVVIKAGKDSPRGYIANFYGRPIPVDSRPPYVKYNYVMQSTGVDVALLGFKRVFDAAAALDPLIKPLFVLHDAALLDIPPGAEKHIDGLIEAGSTIPGFDVKFYMSHEVLNGAV